jgi:hypothetical protein
MPGIRQSFRVIPWKQVNEASSGRPVVQPKVIRTHHVFTFKQKAPSTCSHESGKHPRSSAPMRGFSGWRLSGPIASALGLMGAGEAEGFSCMLVEIEKNAFVLVCKLVTYLHKQRPPHTLRDARTIGIDVLTIRLIIPLLQLYRVGVEYKAKVVNVPQTEVTWHTGEACADVGTAEDSFVRLAPRRLRHR